MTWLSFSQSVRGSECLKCVCSMMHTYLCLFIIQSQITDPDFHIIFSTFRLWKVWPQHSVSHHRTLSKHRLNIVYHPPIPYWQCWNGLKDISCDANHAPIHLPIAQKRRMASPCKCHSISFRPHYSHHRQITLAAAQTRTLFRKIEREWTKIIPTIFYST